MRKSGTSDVYDKLRFLLLEARKKAGLKQAELAERMNRPKVYVSRYETGERRLDVVEFLEVSEALGVDSNHLLTELKEYIRKIQADLLS